MTILPPDGYGPDTDIQVCDTYATRMSADAPGCSQTHIRAWSGLGPGSCEACISLGANVPTNGAIYRGKGTHSKPKPRVWQPAVFFSTAADLKRSVNP